MQRTSEAHLAYLRKHKCVKCDNNNSPTNSGIKVALHKTGYGNVCI